MLRMGSVVERGNFTTHFTPNHDSPISNQSSSNQRQSLPTAFFYHILRIQVHCVCGCGSRCRFSRPSLPFHVRRYSRYPESDGLGWKNKIGWKNNKSGWKNNASQLKNLRPRTALNLQSDLAPELSQQA